MGKLGRHNLMASSPRGVTENSNSKETQNRH